MSMMTRRKKGIGYARPLATAVTAVAAAALLSGAPLPGLGQAMGGARAAGETVVTFFNPNNKTAMNGAGEFGAGRDFGQYAGESDDMEALGTQAEMLAALQAVPAKIPGKMFDGWYFVEDEIRERVTADTVLKDLEGHIRTTYPGRESFVYADGIVTFTGGWVNSSDASIQDVTVTAWDAGAHQITTIPQPTLRESGGTDARVEYDLLVPYEVTNVDLAMTLTEPVSEPIYTGARPDEPVPEIRWPEIEYNDIAVDLVLNGETAGTAQGRPEDESFTPQPDSVQAQPGAPTLLTDRSKSRFQLHSRFSAVSLELKPGENTLVATVTAPDGVTKMEYVFYIIRSQARISLDYGNSPFGEIMKSTGAGWDEPGRKEEAKEHFRIDHKFTTPWPSGCVFRDVYDPLAWYDGAADAVEVSSDTALRDSTDRLILEEGEYVNYDHDQYALFVTPYDAFADPGIHLYNLAGGEVAPDRDHTITRTIRRDGAVVETAQLNGAEDELRITALVGGEPGIYTVCYEYVDAQDPDQNARTVRTVVVLPLLGDVDSDGAVTAADGALLERKGGQWPVNSAAERLFCYRVADVDRNGAAEVQDSAELYKLMAGKAPYHSTPTGQGSRFYILPEPRKASSAPAPDPDAPVEPGKAQLWLDYLGKDLNTPLPAPPEQPSDLVPGDYVWVGLRLEGGLDLGEVTHFTVAFDYDSRYLRPTIGSVADRLEIDGWSGFAVTALAITGGDYKDHPDRAVTGLCQGDTSYIRTIYLSVSGGTRDLSGPASTYLIRFPFQMTNYPPDGTAHELYPLIEVSLSPETFALGCADAAGYVWSMAPGHTGGLDEHMQLRGGMVLTLGDKPEPIILPDGQYGYTYLNPKGQPVSEKSLRGHLLMDDTKLPPGIAYMGAGLFRGTPTVAGEYHFYSDVGQEYIINVQKAPMILIADDKERVYGDANPEFTYTVDETKLLFGDTVETLLADMRANGSEPTLTCAANERTQVSENGTDSCTIYMTGAKSTNYSFEQDYSLNGDPLIPGEQRAGQLTIHRRTITVDELKPALSAIDRDLGVGSGSIARFTERRSVTLAGGTGSGGTFLLAGDSGRGALSGDNIKLSFLIDYKHGRTDYPEVSLTGAASHSYTAYITDLTLDETFGRGGNYELLQPVEGEPRQQNVSFTAKLKEISSIRVRTQPKLAYVYGDTLDLTDLAVEVNYDNGTRETVAYSGTASGAFADFTGASLAARWTETELGSAATGLQLIAATHHNKTLTIDGKYHRDHTVRPSAPSQRITIGKRALHVIPQDTQRVYGEEDPELTFIYNSADFILGDTPENAGLTAGLVAPVFKSDAQPGSPVGTYTISISNAGEAGSDNYRFVFDATATLTVTRRPITVDEIRLTLPTLDKDVGRGDPETPVFTEMKEATYSQGEVTFLPVSGGLTNAPIYGSDDIRLKADLDYQPSHFSGGWGGSQSWKMTDVLVTGMTLDETYGAGGNYTLAADVPRQQTQQVKVSDKAVRRLTVQTVPKLDYVYGQPLTFAGLTILVDYTNNTQVQLSYDDAANTFPGFPGVEIGVRWSDSGVGAAAGERLTVKGNSGRTLTIYAKVFADQSETTVELGTVSVTKKLMHVLPDSQSRIYGEGNPAFTYRYAQEDFAWNEGPQSAEFLHDLVAPVYNTTATADTAVGVYYTIAADSQIIPVSDNYAFDLTAVAPLTIERRPITIDEVRLTLADLDREIGRGTLEAPVFTEPAAALWSEGQVVFLPVHSGLTGTPVYGGDDLRFALTLTYPPESFADLGEGGYSRKEITAVVTDLTLDETYGAGGNYELVQTQPGQPQQQTQKLWVNDKAVRALTVETAPRLSYTYGEHLDLTGFTILVDYSNGSRETVAFGPDGCEGYTGYALGLRWSDGELAGREVSHDDFLTVLRDSGHTFEIYARRAADQEEETVPVGTVAVAPLELTFQLAAEDIVYNGRPDTAGTVTLTNVVTPPGGTEDAVTAGGTFRFTDVQAGEDIPVEVTELTLSGADAGNYHIVSQVVDDTSQPARPRATVHKAPRPAPGAVPAAQIDRHTNVMTVTIGVEPPREDQAVFEYSIDGENYQLSPVFENLEQGRTYTVRVRVQESRNYFASPDVTAQATTYKYKIVILSSQKVRGENGTMVDEVSHWTTVFTNIDVLEDEKALMAVLDLGEDVKFYGYYKDQELREAYRFPLTLEKEQTIWVQPTAPNDVVRPRQVYLEPDQLRVMPGAAPVRLVAKFIPFYTTQLSVTWTSTNPAVARVNKDGVVTFVGEGTAMIVATATNGVYGTAMVYVGRLAQLGLNPGMLAPCFTLEGPGLFRPDDDLTRAEAAVLLDRLLSDGTQEDVEGVSYRDVPQGRWYTGAIERMTACGILEGVGGGRFEPERGITRAEMAALLLRVMELTPVTPDGSWMFRDVDATRTWAAVEIETLARMQLVCGRGDGRYDPEASITRAEMATVVDRIFLRGQLLAPEQELLYPSDVGKEHWAYSSVIRVLNYRIFDL